MTINDAEIEAEGADLPVQEVVPNRTGTVVLGLTIILVGVMLFLGRLGVIDSPEVWRLLWPFLIMAIALGKMARPDAHGCREGGGLLFIGVWFLLNQLEVLQYRDSWPLLLVGFGFGMVWKAIRRSAHRSARKVRG